MARRRLASLFAPTLFAATLFVTALLVAACGSAAAQQVAPQRLRGTIEAVDGERLKLKSRDGATLDVKITDASTVVAVVKASLEEVKVDKFVGIATLPQPDGTQRALEVLIFPEAARGSNEGHYAWDLQPDSMMTNANVTELVERVDGPMLTLRYKDGEKRIFVPKEAPVVTFAPGDRAMVQPGAHAMIVAVKDGDGSFTANRLLVGKDGLVPPM